MALSRIAGDLAESKAPFALVGGLAVSARTEPRFTRDADIAATREELERMRDRAAAEIDAEKHRAIADLRAEVADLALAAAGKVVGESMTGDRQRRLVEEFLRETASSDARN